jgi:cytochrome c oxidase subunit 2
MVNYFKSNNHKRGLRMPAPLLFTLLAQSVETPASLQAEKINRLFSEFNVAAAGMLLLIIGLVTYICIRFRYKPGNLTEPMQTKGNNKLEVAMIVFPALLLAYFCYETIITQKEVLPDVVEGRKPDVIITAHQWWWEAEYPGTNAITANEVHLPVGKHLLIELRSADVIHSWWVPALGNKMDVIPGKSNYLWLDIQKVGDYKGACSEFCGAQHAWMRIHVIAQNVTDFNNWQSLNEKDAGLVKDSLALIGENLFSSKSCAGCHAIRGTNATSHIGPDLTHIGSRNEMLTGIMKVNEPNLSQWISHAQKIKPGANMPDFTYDADSIKAIAHYLFQLK